MRDRFWAAFADELEKKAGWNPLAVKSVAESLKNLGRIGLFGLAAYGGYKGLQEMARAIDVMTWFPEGIRRRFRRKEERELP